jgi:23S rRNA pseudouridine1911/1915/1917 synthase
MTDEFHNLRPLAKWVRHGSIRIEDPTVNARLDRYLAGRFLYRSRTQWARVIEAGRIQVNGRSCRPSRVIHFGDRIDYIPRRLPEPAVSLEIPVLYEDEAILAVNKPANLPVHPSGRYFRNTLLCLLLDARGETLDAPGIWIVHRLDRETSGVVLFGKSREATARLAQQFEGRRVEKEYLVLVHGAPASDRFRVEANLGQHPTSQIRKAIGVVPSDQGKPAVTEFEVLRRAEGHALLLARPRTGRLHQIRVHAKHAGFPVVGDKLYGLDERYFLQLVSGEGYSEEDRAQLLVDRQWLHAWRIRLLHPGSGQPFMVAAPVPTELAGLCARLGIDLSNLPCV